MHPTEKPGRADLPLLWGELSATPRSSCPFSVFHTAPGREAFHEHSYKQKYCAIPQLRVSGSNGQAPVQTETRDKRDRTLLGRGGLAATRAFAAAAEGEDEGGSGLLSSLHGARGAEGRGAGDSHIAAQPFPTTTQPSPIPSPTPHRAEPRRGTIQSSGMEGEPSSPFLVKG